MPAVREPGDHAPRHHPTPYALLPLCPTLASSLTAQANVLIALHRSRSPPVSHWSSRHEVPLPAPGDLGGHDCGAAGSQGWACSPVWVASVARPPAALLVGAKPLGAGLTERAQVSAEPSEMCLARPTPSPYPAATCSRRRLRQVSLRMPLRRQGPQEGQALHRVLPGPGHQAAQKCRLRREEAGLGLPLRYRAAHAGPCCPDGPATLCFHHLIN